MPTCQNCGSHVTFHYVRVFEGEGVEEPEACPRCSDLVRTGGKVREDRS